MISVSEFCLHCYALIPICAGIFHFQSERRGAFGEDVMVLQTYPLQVLISRLYRTDFKCDSISYLHINWADKFYPCRRSIADVFRIQVVSNSDVRSPIITLGSTSFFHVRINNLYIVAVTKYLYSITEYLAADNVIQNQRECCTGLRVLLSIYQHMQELLWEGRRRSSEEQLCGNIRTD